MSGAFIKEQKKVAPLLWKKCISRDALYAFAVLLVAYILDIGYYFSQSHQLSNGP